MGTFGAAQLGEWRSRKVLAWAIRMLTVVLPLVAAVASMLVVARFLHRPRSGLGKLAWYALLLGESWVVARWVSRGVDRTLPLAALLEMSLSFPESAPNRLGMSQRGSSASMLAHLAVSPPDETAQEAAERILRLLTALSSHDRFTRGHAERVRAYTDLIAERLELSSADRDRLRWAALLHDIGKLQVPSGLLNKTGQPTPAEWDILRRHPVAGSVIAAPLLAWLSPMDRVIAEHHERWDGSGYPAGLSGEEISFGARIVTVADSFEAMTAARAYSTPMKREAALREVVRCAGKQFDPTVVRAFLTVPQRRLAWAMGPAAWLTGLPIVGQGSLNVARTAAAHAGTAAVGVTSLAVVALAPAAFATSTTQPVPPVPVPAAAGPVIAAASATPIAAGPPPSPSPAATTPPAASAAVAAATNTTAPAAMTTPATPITRAAAAPATARPTHTAKPPATPAPAVRPTKPTPDRTPAPPAVQAAPAPATASAPDHPLVTATPQPARRKPKKTKPGKPRVAKPTPVAATPAPAPPSPAPTPPAPATTTTPAQCVASYLLTPGTHGDQFAAVTTVRNTGATTTHSWTVTWTFGGNEQVQSFAGTALTQVGQRVSAANTADNGALAPAATTTFDVAGARHGAADLPAVTCTAA